MSKPAHTVDKLSAIVKTLTNGTDLSKWDITVEICVLKPSGTEKHVDAEIWFDEALRRAKIYVDPRFPRRGTVCTIEELIAHELGHLILGNQIDEELAASRIGQLLLANCHDVTISDKCK
jgi:hypothetical protein